MALIKCRITQDYCYNNDYGNCHDCDVAKNNTTYLKPCPFCGGTNIIIANCKTLGDCEDSDECEEDGFVSAVCDYNQHGCGASNGYYKNKKEAIAAWNRRVGESE